MSNSPEYIIRINSQNNPEQQNSAKQNPVKYLENRTRELLLK